jgi:segregation and condensation protein B
VADKPVSSASLAKAAQAPIQEVKRLLLALIEEYRGRGVELAEVAGGYQFRSNIANAPFVRDFIGKKPTRLSRAQLETIAIVSYRQPITRPEVEDIRGVDCGASIKTLLERDLIKILGRKEEAGRPLLYGTTPRFLEMFSLKGLKDLPTLQEFSELNEESRALFEKNTGESLSDMHFAEATLDESFENDEAIEAQTEALEEELAQMKEASEHEARSEEQNVVSSDDASADFEN